MRNTRRNTRNRNPRFYWRFFISFASCNAQFSPSIPPLLYPHLRLFVGFVFDLLAPAVEDGAQAVVGGFGAGQIQTAPFEWTKHLLQLGNFKRYYSNIRKYDLGRPFLGVVHQRIQHRQHDQCQSQ